MIRFAEKFGDVHTMVHVRSVVIKEIFMKITVVTIVYNDVRHIEATLLNVLGQTSFDNIEYIVVDGASNDGTSDVIKKYSDRIDRYICEPDTGIYNAMNKGLDAATGDYIIFINCGDRLSSASVISKIIYAIKDERPDVVYGTYREIDGSGVASKVIPCRSSDKIWYGPVASHQSTFYRIEHLRQWKLRYDESYKIAADYKITAQAIQHARKVFQTDICISDFDVSGVSSVNQNAGLSEANRVRREVFNWSEVRIACLTAVLLCARYTKKYAGPLYKLIRF